MARALEAVVAVVDLIGAAAFAYITLSLARIARSAGGRLEAPLAFSLLVLAQVFAAIAALASARVAYTAYVATASFSAAGFLILVTVRGRLVALVPAAIVPLATDIVAALSAAWASMSFSGLARLLVAGLGLSFIVRLAGLLLLPSVTGVLVLALGEILRSMGAAVLAVVYAMPAGGKGVGEAEEE